MTRLDSRNAGDGGGRDKRLVRLLTALVAAVAVAAGLAYWKLSERVSGQAASLVTMPGAQAGAAAFQPTVENTSKPTGETPAGMVWIPGGEFSMGAADSPSDGAVGMQATEDSRPIHRVYVD